jgi:glycosyltransferase involved in cell wall biosynthesis
MALPEDGFFMDFTGQEMDRSRLVSVVIPSYNSLNFIADTLASVYAQSFSSFEVIVVDDGSTDGSWELLHKLKSELYSNLIILCHEGRQNRGESLARALAVSVSSGQYIAFLDADDLFGPDKLSKQIAAMEASPSCVLCHTAIEVIGDLSKADWFVSALSNSPKGVYHYQKLPDYLYRNRICASSVVVRAATLEKIHFATYTVLGFGDWFTWSLLSDHGSFLFLPDQLTVYRVHADSKTERFSKSKLRRLFGLLEYKLSLLARTDSSSHAVRILFSTIETLRLIVVEYLWDPADQFRPSSPIRSNLVVRTLLAIGKIARSFGRKVN